MTRDRSQKSQQRSESIHRTLYYAFHNPLYVVMLGVSIMGFHAMYEEWAARRRQARIDQARAASRIPSHQA